jgi:hypothetical protein
VTAGQRQALIYLKAPAIDFTITLSDDQQCNAMHRVAFAGYERLERVTGARLT